MANPPRQPMTELPRTPPNPMLLQGDTPGRDDPKATLLALLQDPDVIAALRALLPSVSAELVAIPTAMPAVEPDAALATWVQDLIEQKLRQQIRSDAFRLPR